MTALALTGLRSRSCHH